MDYPNMICYTHGGSPIGRCDAHHRPLDDCRRMYEKSEAEKENASLRAEVSDATALAYNLDPDRTEPSEMELLPYKAKEGKG